MIYFDNASTTKYKPDEVYEAENYYLREIGVSPGRGSYALGIEAMRMLYKSRLAIGNYFCMSEADRVIFTKNSTEAINLFFNGYLKKGDHAIISCYEHNAVLRPIQRLADLKIITYSIIKRDDLRLSASELFRKYTRKNTRLLALTLASNLTGRIIFKEDWFKYFREKGVCTFLDSSQGAGRLPLSMKSQSIDFLAFTSHKDLLGIPGAGGLCCESKEHFEPLIQGGTGVHGESYTNPDIFPEGYEAGTLNMSAIWALRAGIEFLNKNRESIQTKENSLMRILMNALHETENVTIYDFEEERIPVCCFTINDQSSDKTVRALDENGICVRGGVHCAVLAHESIGTIKTGAVRISLSFKNSQEEIERFVKLIKEIASFANRKNETKTE